MTSNNHARHKLIWTGKQYRLERRLQRLTNSFPAERLSRVFTNLGRIIKTKYVLRYISQPRRFKIILDGRILSKP